MSYNHFYTNFFGNNVTFQNFPPPPPPPPRIDLETSDQEFLKRFETCVPTQKPRIKLSVAKIFKIKEELSSLVSALANIQEQENELSQSVSTLSEEDWQSAFNRITSNKYVINSIISNMHGSLLDLGKKLIAKRVAKQLRLKRVREELKLLKQERFKQQQEKSRKIDENLQKIQDDIQRAKQVEEDKLQADVVLREVLRKKYDAKKSIVKLEALVKLRKARLNTAKGMGKSVMETETTNFMETIDKIKALWEHKLSIYTAEEHDLRQKLEKNSQQDLSIANKEVLNNLMKWKEAMFGDDINPQVNFKGNLEQFLSVRSAWDLYIDNGPEATPIPIGWVTPSPKI